MWCDFDSCKQRAVHRMFIDDDQLASVCCVHADEVMATARETVPAAEGAAGWRMWVADHRRTCGSAGGDS